MIIKIYHYDLGHFHDILSRSPQAGDVIRKITTGDKNTCSFFFGLDNGTYTHIASLIIASSSVQGALKLAYSLSQNNSNMLWKDNDGVNIEKGVEVPVNGFRSTGAGDVIVIADGDKETAYVLSATEFGWQEI